MDWPTNVDNGSLEEDKSSIEDGRVKRTKNGKAIGEINNDSLDK